MNHYFHILKLSLPIALGMVNNALMQFVDRAFLAKDSMTSLEASLPAAMVSLIACGFFQSVVSYSGTFVAQYHGAKDEKGEIDAYRGGLFLALLFGVMMPVFVPLGNLVLERFANGPEVLAAERTYFNILTLGGIALYGQMSVASYFTGLGKTMFVFWVNLFGNLVNIVLDYILIFGCGKIPALGIAGAAIGTVSSLLIQWIILALRLHITKSIGFSIPWKLIGKIIRYGAPSGIYSSLNVLSFTVFVFITEGVGHLAFAVSNACFSVNYLLFAPMEGFAIGASTLVGQYIGRGDSAGAEKAGWRTMILAVSIVAVMSLAAVLCYEPIIGIFAPDNVTIAGEFKSLGFVLFLMMAAWQVFDAADIVLAGALKGTGDTVYVMTVMIAGAFALWLPIVFIVNAICPSMPALWSTMIIYCIVVCTFSAYRWKKGTWKKHNLLSHS